MMKHYYETLPGWAAFGDLYTVVVEKAKGNGKEVFVEVGSWLGRSAALMGVEIINSGKDIGFICVDPWTDGGPDLKDTKYYKELRRPVYDMFLENIEPVSRLMGKRFATFRMPSVEAAAKFDDASVDFIMLDGDHSYEGIHADIEAWLPKMKPRGIMAGDDYLWPGVTKAADEQFGERLKPVIKKAAHDYKKSVAYWWVQLP